jgi:Tol biopolymer transport system component
MRSICLFILVFSVCGSYAQDIKSFDYCYTSKGGIYFYSASKKKAELIVKETDPYISPDGSKLACTVNSPKGDRQVEVIDLATKQKTLLHTSNNNCYGPVWSPDGQLIAYNAFINNSWFICIIDKDNHTPVVITKSLSYSTGAYSPTWSADSKKILVHNMDTVFVFTTQAKLIEKIPVASFAEATDITSASKFMLTSDESKIVFDCSVNEPGFDEPPGAIFIFDRKAKTTKRLTPKGYWCQQPFLKGDRIYFSASKKKSDISNIYSMKPDGSDFKLELSNGTDFTSKIN